MLETGKPLPGKKEALNVEDDDSDGEDDFNSDFLGDTLMDAGYDGKADA